MNRKNRKNRICCKMRIRPFLISGIAIMLSAQTFSPLLTTVSADSFDLPALYGSSNVSLLPDSSISVNVDYFSADLTAKLIPDDKSMQTARQNAAVLQAAIDTASENGGGTVYMPSGTFYFKGENPGFGQSYIIKLRSNVHLRGAGKQKTVLKPYGDFSHTDGKSTRATAMFYYNNYRESDGEDMTPLENADFSDFTVDCGEYSYTETYNTGGQTFGIKLYRNCHFQNISVLNSPATGFGCDSPINSSFTNCYAENCGRQAREDEMGASGFGIGLGITNEESVSITDCRAVNCKKYGFFFEHQGVFTNRDLFPATEGNFTVKNCTARGNQYDFGANRGNGVTYTDCTSENPANNSEKARNKAPFYTENHSHQIRFENCVVRKSCSDVKTDAWYTDAVYYAQDNYVASADTQEIFGTGRNITRWEALQMLYQTQGEPGNICTQKTVPQETSFEDVPVSRDGYDAVLWASTEDIGYGISDTLFDPDTVCTRKEFITFLWRIAGKPVVSKQADSSFRDVPENAWYRQAVFWASQNGIAAGILPGYFCPNEPVTKAQAAVFLYKYLTSRPNYN